MNRPSFAAALTALCALCGLLLMAFIFVRADHSIVKETRSRGNIESKSQESMPAASGMPAGAPQNDAQAAVTGQQADDLTQLMQKLQAAPNDADVLRQIGGIFIDAKDWRRAEVFLTKAVLSRPGDVRPRYLLAVSQYQQDKFPDAAKSFEELIVIKEDPAAMYNLACIYKYHLGKKDEAMELLRKVIASSTASPETISKAKAEM